MTNRLAAIEIIKTLHRNGFQALFAGGCVRDKLLKRPAKDYDIATDATPKQVIKLFRRTIKIGAKFGVIIVLIQKQQVEVATFRTETGYVDGRHPTSVKFSNPKEDASRRDFTINGMFYDPIQKKVIDYVKGQADLKKRLIRTIGKPNERFSEDYLRMLRAIRFSTQLNFKIESETLNAVCKNAKKITKISAERIASELEGTLIGPNRPTGAKLLIKAKLTQIIFPGIEDKHTRFAVKVLANLPDKINFPLALSAFFAACDTDFAIKNCKKLKLSTNQTKHIKFLLVGRGKLLDKDMSLAKLKLTLASVYFEDLYQLQKAIQKAARKTIAPLTALRKRINALGDIELSPKPLLDGHELMKLGAPSGPALGKLAKQMYIAQLEEIITTKTNAKNWVKTRLKKQKNPVKLTLKNVL